MNDMGRLRDRWKSLNVVATRTAALYSCRLNAMSPKQLSPSFARSNSAHLTNSQLRVERSSTTQHCIHGYLSSSIIYYSLTVGGYQLH
ncbi:uncharacterized protein YALI1_F18226g [Yarrowia lipolytica]|uniref:Uncharacterized protein n=1 Tax=Yarrowia lipolytica TaxID=4952 RepID=A0A1D8NNB5_YARLL|nr:hypothetical protein YALI1_F18226g [Yarrowia lipolytica]